MLENTIQVEKKGLEVAPQGLDAALRVDESFCAKLPLPSIQELQQIKRLSFDSISLRETMYLSDGDLKEAFRCQRDKLQRSYDRFRSSTSYLNRLASLNLLAGDSEKAKAIFNDAFALSADPFFTQQILAHLFANRDLEGAERKLAAVETGQANLMLAYLMLLRNDTTRSRELLQVSLQQEVVDPNAYTLAGVLELVSGGAQKAVRYFRAAIELRPAVVPLYVNLAIAYQFLDETRKAIASLRKAVAINPIDRNAIMFYSDVLFKNNKHEETIRVLDNYLRYDRKDFDAWDRLARAFYIAKRYRQALDAAKQRASLRPGPNAWNNIALIYWRMKQNEKAYQYFAKALEALPQDGDLNWVPVTNCLDFLHDQAAFGEIKSLVVSLLKEFTFEQLASKEESSSICGHYILALAELGQESEAEQLALRLLGDSNLSDPLHYQLLIFITYFYSLRKYDADKLLKFCERTFVDLDKIKYFTATSRAYLVNNLVYCLLELGRNDEAERLLTQMSSLIHKEATVTATFGLFHLRKGRKDKGELLYREAIQLANDQLRDKLKQKLDLELGRFFLKAERFDMARKYLLRAISAKPSLEQFAAQATQLINQLQS